MVGVRILYFVLLCLQNVIFCTIVFTECYILYYCVYRILYSVLLCLQNDHRQKHFESEQQRQQADEAIRKLQEQKMVNQLLCAWI